MIADVNLQVWLDAQPRAGQTVMIPYVKSSADRRLTYRLDVTQRSVAGTSRVSQQGQVSAHARQPTALGRVALSGPSAAKCSVELRLREDGKIIGEYHFDCPR